MHLIKYTIATASPTCEDKPYQQHLLPTPLLRKKGPCPEGHPLSTENMPFRQCLYAFMQIFKRGLREIAGIYAHIDAGNSAAKFWLTTGELARSRGFKGHELSILRKLVVQHKQELLEAWNVYSKRTV